MNSETLRIICVAMLGMSLLILYSNWERAQQAAFDNANNANGSGSITTTATTAATDSIDNATQARGNENDNTSDVPQPTQSLSAQPSTTSGADEDLPTARNTADEEFITAETDWLLLRFAPKGGNLVEAQLKKHLFNAQPLRLLEQDNRFYIAQSGLIGQAGLPNHNTDFTYAGAARNLSLADGQESLTLDFTATTDNNDITLTKRYIIHRADYVIDMHLRLENNSGVSDDIFAYFQLAHDSHPPRNYSTFLPTFFGAAMYTEADKFNKIDFEDADGNYPRKSDNGWIGIIQRYFASVWLPPEGAQREYFIRRSKDGGVRVGFIAPMPAGAESQVAARLFVGAQEQEVLDSLQTEDNAKGIALVVDYGWLTFIALPLFAALSFLESYLGNWGIAIILLTFAIKLLFYPLSSAAYRSMAKMKEEAPRIKRMQEQFGDDKQRLQKEMMELYRKKKINPLGGCLPILIQIPVFIALYWVLLGSVELRQAPFALWIDDLSVPDPYYVLSLIMGIAMFLQTKLSPAPPDPTQAMVMKIMPIGFAGFSILFPSGLVLYWAVNTILSIAQQWYITRRLQKPQPSTT